MFLVLKHCGRQVTEVAGRDEYSWLLKQEWMPIVPVPTDYKSQMLVGLLSSKPL